MKFDRSERMEFFITGMVAVIRANMYGVFFEVWHIWVYGVFLLRDNMYLCGVSVSEEHFSPDFLVLYAFPILFYDPIES